eukprot:702593_1
MSSFPLSKSHSQWEKDSSVNHCNICNVKLMGSFPFTSGKHHCRKCGRIVCGGCSHYKYMNHKVCHDCNLDFTAKHIPNEPNPDGCTPETLITLFVALFKPSVTAIDTSTTTAVDDTAKPTTTEGSTASGDGMDGPKKPSDGESTPNYAKSDTIPAAKLCCDTQQQPKRPIPPISLPSSIESLPKTRASLSPPRTVALKGDEHRTRIRKCRHRKRRKPKRNHVTMMHFMDYVQMPMLMPIIPPALLSKRN